METSSTLPVAREHIHCRLLLRINRSGGPCYISAGTGHVVCGWSGLAGTAALGYFHMLYANGSRATYPARPCR